jgi:hypothetical protein
MGASVPNTMLGLRALSNALCQPAAAAAVRRVFFLTDVWC